MPWVSQFTAVAGQLMTAALWNTYHRDAFNLVKTCLDDNGHLSFPTATTLTISAAAVTPAQNIHKIDGAATDNLSTLTISGTFTSSRSPYLLITAANLAHVVTVKNGVGNIVLKMGDFVLSSADRWLLLMLSGSTWYEISRSDLNGAAFQIGPYSETKNVPVIATGNIPVDLSKGNHFFPAVLAANVTTITVSNIPASPLVASFTLALKQDGTGGRTVAFSFASGTLLWSFATAPVMTATANKTDVYAFMSYDGGTTWWGFVVGQSF